MASIVWSLRRLGTDISIRFQEIPPFGVDGIRKIRSNRSELKKMTAHDYEDMLQVGVIASILNLTDIIHIVCYIHFLWSSAWTPQYIHSQALIWISPLAWSCQAQHAHGCNSGHFIPCHYISGKQPTHIWGKDMWSIWDSRVGMRACCLATTSGEICN